MTNYITRSVLIVLGLICIGLAAVDLYVARHSSLGFDSIPFFYCVLGFIAYAALIFMAKALRRVISRPENYYGLQAIDSESEAKHD